MVVRKALLRFLPVLQDLGAPVIHEGIRLVEGIDGLIGFFYRLV